MTRIVFITLTLVIANSLAYHDPDLNYHLSQVNKLQDCGSPGYSYPVPPVQLTTAGVKLAAPPSPQPGAYAYSNAAAGAYSAGLGYNAGLSKIGYAPQAPAFSQSSYVSHPSYSAGAAYSAQQEVHGYATSAGLSSYNAGGRTVIPSPTYAQAPIIAKITAAPLIAKYAISPPKTTYLTQNSLSQQSAYSAAKASLNSYSSVHSGGPVVAQVFSAPSAGSYAVSPALRQPLPPAPLQSPRYTAVNQLAAPRYSAPTVAEYFSPANQYASPAVQYAPPPVQYAPAAPVNQYAAPVGIAPVAAPVQHIPAPAPVPIATGIAKNVHTDFLENYDPHPRYAYEYSVNDPHTGDVKQQKEERDGDVVRGQYSLVEPDGSVRTVDYVADWDTGFHATVRNSKDAQH